MLETPMTSLFQKIPVGKIVNREGSRSSCQKKDQALAGNEYRDYYLMYFRKLLELASAPYLFPLVSTATPSTVIAGLSAGPGIGMKLLTTPSLALPIRIPL